MNTSDRMKYILVTLTSIALLFPFAAWAQDKTSDSKGKSDPASNSVRLTIVVTNGEDKKPVDSASV
jgi:hypothetical protein